MDLDGIPANATFSYQWQTSADGTTWSAISGATSNTLLLAQAQVGLKIRVATSYTDSLGKSETANSTASTSVQSTFVSLGLKAPTPIPNSDTIENVISFWIGDINGDGLADWLLGTSNNVATAPTVVPRANIFFGNTNASYAITTTNGVTTGGTLINNFNPTNAQANPAYIEGYLSYVPIGLGDMDGDGFGEIAIGNCSKPASMKLYVYSPNISNTTPVKTISNFSLGTNSPSTSPWFANTYNYGYLDGGDINGDGFSDLLSGNFLSNCAFVFYGNRPETSLDFNTSGLTGHPERGFQIIDSHGDPILQLGLGFSFLGDTNGDGIGDMAIANINRYSDAGSQSVYVLFGNSNQINSVDLNNLKSGTSTLGYVIHADPNLPLLGVNLGYEGTKCASDFNGDGLNDLVIEGATYPEVLVGDLFNLTSINNHVLYVIFGKTTTNSINLNALGNQGYTITMSLAGLSDSASYALRTSNTGDMNGDGLDDLLVTATWLSNNSSTLNLSSYVVYGKTDNANIDLSTIGNYGFKVYTASQQSILKPGENFLTSVKGSVASPGDINGDGLPDLLVDDFLGTRSGMPAIVFGSKYGAYRLGSQAGTTQPSTQWKVNFQGGTGNDSLSGDLGNISETFVAGAGDDVVRGNGGSDVMYGGAGNDAFILTQSNITQLSSPMDSSGRLARIDGGAGIDTISLDGSTGITFDLTSMPNNRIQSVEKFNLSTGANTLKISWKDIQQMAAMNLYNNSNGWSGFDATTTKYHQIVVDGDVTSACDISEGGWVRNTNTITNATSGQAYTLYTNAAHATELIINNQITSSHVFI